MLQVRLQASALLECVFQLRYLALEVQAAVVTAATHLVDLVVMVPLAQVVQAVVLVVPQAVVVLAVTVVQAW